MKSKKLLATILTLTLVSTSLLAGCGSNPTSNNETKPSNVQITTVEKASDPGKNPDVAKNRKDTLVIGSTEWDGTFNPLYIESSYDMYVANEIFEGMMRVDEYGLPTPAIAKSWDISKDGKTYTFKLRDDVKFTSGDPVTADDVAFTYTSIADPSYDGPLQSYVEKLEGFKEYNTGAATSVSGIKVIDKNTISFTETEVKANALYDFAAGILSKKYYDFKKGDTKSLKDKFEKPMGAGPYKMTKYQPGQEVDMVSNDGFYLGAPKIKNLIWKVTNDDNRLQVMSSGETDIDFDVAQEEKLQQYKDLGFVNVYTFPTAGFGFVGWNLTHGPLADVKFRQALAYGLNRKQFVTSYYKQYGQVANTCTSVVSWAYTDDLNKYEFDTAKANKLLDEAGYTKKSDGFRYDKSGKKITLNFTGSAKNEVCSQIQAIAKENWKALGIEVNIENLEFSAMRTKVRKGDTDLWFMAHGLVADPDAKTQYYTGQIANDAKWADKHADELMDKGLQELDQNKRKTIYQDFFKYYNEQLPELPIYQRKDAWLVNDRVQGFACYPFKDFSYDLYKYTLK